MDASTIIALATHPGVSALALIRMSGPEAIAYASTLSAKPIKPRSPVYTELRHEGTLIDDVVVTSWIKPASYTGEDLVEISCHGNMLIVERILETLLSLGARMAGPGEFTQRAFLNGKMDLTQAESVVDLINARTERSLRAARAMQAGALGRHLENERENLLQVLAHLEAYIDFPDEDIEPETGQRFIESIRKTRHVIDHLLASAREGKLLREGLKVALVGEPNAGKSSLMNALLDRDRSIVSAIAGTTRDTVEESIQLDGIQVHLIDTAGLRESNDEIEQLGIARTRKAIEEADLLLWMVDASLPEKDNEPPAFPPSVPVLKCLNKSDLTNTDGNGRGEGIRISCKTGEGLADLRKALSMKLKTSESSASLDHIAINTRHEHLLQEAITALDTALREKESGQPPELVSSSLREALNAIGEIVGQVTNEDILDRLFQNFCIGK